jgi:hypothetical protein
MYLFYAFPLFPLFPLFKKVEQNPFRKVDLVQVFKEWIRGFAPLFLKSGLEVLLHFFKKWIRGSVKNLGLQVIHQLE